jgi:hypothetical protein
LQGDIVQWTSAAQDIVAPVTCSDFPVLTSLVLTLNKEKAMATWSKEELRKTAEADDLHISPFREDGLTYSTPTWIWSVAVDDALYVRGYSRVESRWDQAACARRRVESMPRA